MRGADLAASVLVEAELDHAPHLLELDEGLLHLVLFVCLVDHLADVVDEVLQLQLEHVAQVERGVELAVGDRDRHARHAHQLVPVPG